MRLRWKDLTFCVFFGYLPFCPAAHAQTFALSANPASLTVVQGRSVETTINVTPNGGFNADIALGATTQPTGLTCAFSSAKPLAAPYTGGSTLTISASGDLAAGDYEIDIVGVGGGRSGYTTVKLTVQQPAPNAAASATDILKNNFGFGVALGLSANVTGPDIANNATIDANGFVRVNTRANTTAGFMLESHYLIWPTAASACVSEVLPSKCHGVRLQEDPRAWGTGPFVAAQPGSSQIISAVGAGWMIDFRRPKGTMPSGFGLGVGYEAIPAAQVLGAEFVNGQKAPVGPSGQPLPIRYETQDKGAVLVILSVTF